MPKRIALYITGVVVAAVVSTAALYRVASPEVVGGASALVLFSALAVVAELLGFALAQSARGSVAFIPYLAAVIVVPTWETVVAIALVKGVLEVFTRKAGTRIAFNVAQHALTVSVAIWIYRSLGGISLLTLPASPLFHTTRLVGIPALVAFSTSLILNTIVVCTAIAISSGHSVRKIWRDVNISTIGLDLVAGPLIFVFAWVYAAFGAFAAAALWVPILGLRQVHRINLELERTNQELLQLMVKSLEARDPYTSGHSRRVQRYSVIIARAIGMGEREIEQVGRAALLHDVGKIYEKYAPILSKRDKLTAVEWATVQEHPADGANLVATMSGLKEIVTPIRHHHENWDGTGYPDGLAGDLIPLAARIIRFADTLDAMTSERPYRRPLTEDKVRGEIVDGRGTQFDPLIADRLLSSPMWASLFTPPAKALTPRQVLTVVGRLPARESA